MTERDVESAIDRLEKIAKFGITIHAPLELRLRTAEDETLGPVMRVEVWRTDDDTMVTFVRLKPDDVRKLISVSRVMLKTIEGKS